MESILLLAVLLFLLVSAFGDRGSQKKVHKYNKKWRNYSDPSTRSTYWETLRRKILRRDEFKCKRCSARTELNVHHIIPVYLGGTDDTNNLVTLCRDCHKKEHGFNFDDKFHDTYSATEKALLRPRKGINKIMLIEQSIVNKENLKLKYKSEIGEITNRIVAPEEIFIDNRKMYFKGFCYLRNAERTFRISRIKEIEIVNQ